VNVQTLFLRKVGGQNAKNVVVRFPRMDRDLREMSAVNGRNSKEREDNVQPCPVPNPLRSEVDEPALFAGHRGESCRTCSPIQSHPTPRRAGGDGRRRTGTRGRRCSLSPRSDDNLRGRDAKGKKSFVNIVEER
jgi:hypothetical protein